MILLTGGTGQVGRSILAQRQEHQGLFFAPSRAEFDVYKRQVINHLLITKQIVRHLLVSMAVQNTQAKRLFRNQVVVL